jgi:predicted transcriptional regulator YheO
MDHKTSLLEAIALTSEILDLVEQEDLNSISEIEEERQRLIRQVFEPTLEQIDDIKLRHLKNLNDQVVTKLGEVKQRLTEQQQQSHKAGRAARAYQTNK